MKKVSKLLKFSGVCLLMQAVSVGVITGLFVVLFKISITKLFGVVQACSYLLPLITALGGLISGYVVYKFAPETKGSGIPYVKASLMHLGNLTRVRSIFVKFIGGVASIGTGMSLGREGPSVQLGAGSGALIGKVFKLRGTDKDKLISAGAGSAIAATFNAPISGAIFVLEELMQKFNSTVLFPVIIATVVAASVARTFLGDNTSFIIPLHKTNLNILICLLTGIISGFAGVLYSKLIHFNNFFFSKIRIKPYYKTCIAGFVIGFVGLFMPLVLGSGNDAVEILLQYKLSILVVVLVFLAKFILTPFCFGSGAVGGIFLPMLMIGCYLGYIVGVLSNFASVEIDLVAISLVGMASFLAAVARTPITATVMVFEMTGAYNFILPIMLACAVADLIAESCHHKSIYSELIVFGAKNSTAAKYLETKTVSNIMKKMYKTIPQNYPVKDVLKKMKQDNQSFYLVVDDFDKLKGTFQKQDAEDVIINCDNEKLCVKDVMGMNTVVTNEKANLYEIFFELHMSNMNEAVVLDINEKVVGIVERSDLEKILMPYLRQENC